MNIYDIPDDDDAELDGSTLHKFDGSVCYCGEVHPLKTNAGQLPPEILEKLSDFLDAVPKEFHSTELNVERKSPGRQKVLQDFTSFVTSIDSISRSGPIIRALAETLDEMSNGAVSTKWKVYSLERDLMVTHVVLKTVNRMTDIVQTRMDNLGDEGPIMLETIETLRTSTAEKIEKLGQQYVKRASEVGMYVDQQLIETGIFSDDNESTYADWMLTNFEKELDIRSLINSPEEETSKETETKENNEQH